MLTDGRFWFGIIVGMGVVYAWHKVKGLPGQSGS